MKKIKKLLEKIFPFYGEIIRSRKIIAATRSPGLADSPESLSTDRLMAHPVRNPFPNIELSSIPAEPRPNRIKIAERLIDAYHKSISEEKKSSLQRRSEDLWTGLLRQELPALMNSIDQKDPAALSEFLLSFGTSYVWFGGITTCVDSYNKYLDRKHIAVTYLDKLVALAEALGVIPFENPENGPWGENIYLKPDFLIDQIEKKLGGKILAPSGIIHTDGLATSRGVFHYRHINALYSAIRIAQLSKPGDRICEIGGGLGFVAMYAHKLGLGCYTILDLPVTCLLAGHYLLHALGEDKVLLYGETKNRNTVVEILPFWECLNLSDAYFHLVFNQDSFPEIDESLVLEFLTQIKRMGKEYFLSINQEYFHPKTVKNLVDRSKGFQEVYRHKLWVREGYLEELFQIKKA